MTPRPAARLASVPTPKPPERLLTIGELAERLGVSRSKVERDVAAGLPCLDLGAHDPRRRQKRLLRFQWSRVVAWYETAASGRP